MLFRSVGAWLLSDLFSRRGLSWDSVGTYNAACTQLKGEECTRARARYAWKVYRRLPGMSGNTSRRTALARPLEIATAPMLLAVRVSP